MKSTQDPSKPSILLGGGQEICGDVVVGADGVHSGAAETVVGHENQPVPPVHSNYCYRFLVSAATLDEDPETRFWNEQREDWTRLFVHNGTKRRMVVYPCREYASWTRFDAIQYSSLDSTRCSRTRSNTVHNFVGLFYDEDIKSSTRESGSFPPRLTTNFLNCPHRACRCQTRIYSQSIICRLAARRRHLQSSRNLLRLQP